MWPHVPWGQNHPPVENHWGKATVQMLGDCDWAGAWECVPESSHPRWVTQSARTEKSCPIYSPGCWQHISHSGLWQVSFPTNWMLAVTKRYFGRENRRKEVTALSFPGVPLPMVRDTDSNESHIFKGQSRKPCSLIQEMKEQIVKSSVCFSQSMGTWPLWLVAQAFCRYGESEDKCSTSRWWILVRSPRKCAIISLS